MKAKIKVNLVGFGDKGVRFVDIELPGLPNQDDPYDMEYILNEVFHLGQNDFQSKDVRSVSVGDIVELKFRVDPIGFSLMSEKEE
jgi:hypothetical protein